MFRIKDRHGNIQRICETIKRAEKLCRKRKESVIEMQQDNSWIVIKTSQECRNERLS